MSRSARQVSLDEVMPLVRQLSTSEKLRLIEAVVPEIEREISSEQRKPKRSLLGLAADLGTAPSAEEIDDARREAWSTFPRDPSR